MKSRLKNSIDMTKLDHILNFIKEQNNSRNSMNQKLMNSNYGDKIHQRISNRRQLINKTEQKTATNSENRSNKIGPIEFSFPKARVKEKLNTVSIDSKLSCKIKEKKDQVNFHFYSQEDLKRSLNLQKRGTFESDYINDFKSLISKQNECVPTQEVRLKRIKKAYCINKASIFWKSGKTAVINNNQPSISKFL